MDGEDTKQQKNNVKKYIFRKNKYKGHTVNGIDILIKGFKLWN